MLQLVINPSHIRNSIIYNLHRPDLCTFTVCNFCIIDSSSSIAVVAAIATVAAAQMIVGGLQQLARWIADSLTAVDSRVLSIKAGIDVVHGFNSMSKPHGWERIIGNGQAVVTT